MKSLVISRKEFNQKISFIKYTPMYAKRNNSINAIFFGYEHTEEGRGFSHCIYSRSINATKKQLENKLFDFINKKIDDIDEYYINLVKIQQDSQRFTAPLSANGLSTLIKYS